MGYAGKVLAQKHFLWLRWSVFEGAQHTGGEITIFSSFTKLQYGSLTLGIGKNNLQLSLGKLQKKVPKRRRNRRRKWSLQRFIPIL